MRSALVKYGIQRKAVSTNSRQSDRRGVLQQHDGFALLNGASCDHVQRIGGWQFDHLNVFAFAGVAATRRHAILIVIFGDEKMQLLGD